MYTFITMPSDRQQQKKTSIKMQRGLTKLLFEVSQKVTKVNVEQMPILCHHNVAVVTIADPEHKRRYTVARTRANEVIHSLIIQFLVLVVGLQKQVDWVEF